MKKRIYIYNYYQYRIAATLILQYFFAEIKLNNKKV